MINIHCINLHLSLLTGVKILIPDDTLSSDLVRSNEKADCDACVKKILSDKFVIARMLQCYLADFKDMELSDIARHYVEGVLINGNIVEQKIFSPLITGMNTELGLIGEGCPRLDLLFHVLMPRTARSAKST